MLSGKSSVRLVFLSLILGLLLLLIGALILYARTQQSDSEADKAESSATPVQVSQIKADEGALLELATEPWTGDLDGMRKRGFIRVLSVYNPLFFYYDGAEQKGIGYEVTQAFAEKLNKNRPKGTPPLRILEIPVARDRLLPGLIEGKGDIVVANMTVTEERAEIAQFSDPSYSGVKELVVTGAQVTSVGSFDDLAEIGIHLRKSSSYYQHLTKLNEQRDEAGLAEIPITEVDEKLEDYDLLEMVNANLIPAVIVDSHKVDFWRQVFDGITVHENLAVNEGGNIAWAMRKGDTQLLSEVNAFLKEARKGTLLGNVILKRYLGDTKWVEDALSGEGWQRYQDVVTLIKKYAELYEFDWLMIMAQGYQESKLDQNKVSHVGAIGIMQVMPGTAADPAVGIPDIEDPESNVHAGVKYLRWLRKTYFDDPKIDVVDQVLFSFAAYNAGPGGISKARKQAQKMGFDPDRWFGHVEVAASKTISQEPVVYVRNIYKYYVAYKLYENEKAEREAARAAQQD
jgi:membrane-bound lytic murein transglycosylase MltF